ncbi:MAG: hypothetical protein Q8O67_28990 [Deltaproteobacteria bacterium]|nr:hypothetical protein [Deltaproteobacteria bacterium]
MMIEDYGDRTTKAYLGAVARNPTQLGSNEVRAFQLHLGERLSTICPRRRCFDCDAFV